MKIISMAAVLTAATLAMAGEQAPAPATKAEAAPVITKD